MHNITHHNGPKRVDITSVEDPSPGIRYNSSFCESCLKMSARCFAHLSDSGFMEEESLPSMPLSRSCCFVISSAGFADHLLMKVFCCSEQPSSGLMMLQSETP